jgi:hypothetical protein
MKDNTQIAHTKFQKYTTSPTGVITKRKKKTAKSFFGPLSNQHFLFFSKYKTLRVSKNPLAKKN